MKAKDVPQSPGMRGRWTEVAYVIDDAGRYALASSRGWEPATIANSLAWELIDAEVRSALGEIAAGKKSNLTYFMAQSLMDVALLARYVHLARFRVRRHLKPTVFARLGEELLARYAAVFQVSVDALREPAASLADRWNDEHH